MGQPLIHEILSQATRVGIKLTHMPLRPKERQTGPQQSRLLLFINPSILKSWLRFVSSFMFCYLYNEILVFQHLLSTPGWLALRQGLRWP